MIQPLQIEMSHGNVKPGKLAGVDDDDAMLTVPVEFLTIVSGPYRGLAVGYIRYLPDVEPIGDKCYQWQVAKRMPQEDEYMHYSTYPSLNAAMHGAMACAYSYVSGQLD